MRRKTRRGNRNRKFRRKFVPVTLMGGPNANIYPMVTVNTSQNFDLKDSLNICCSPAVVPKKMAIYVVPPRDTDTKPGTGDLAKIIYKPQAVAFVGNKSTTIDMGQMVSDLVYNGRPKCIYKVNFGKWFAKGLQLPVIVDGASTPKTAYDLGLITVKADNDNTWTGQALNVIVELSYEEEFETGTPIFPLPDPSKPFDTAKLIDVNITASQMSGSRTIMARKTKAIQSVMVETVREY